MRSAEMSLGAAKTTRVAKIVGEGEVRVTVWMRNGEVLRFRVVLPMSSTLPIDAQQRTSLDGDTCEPSA